jgi:hypothetical protein
MIPPIGWGGKPLGIGAIAPSNNIIGSRVPEIRNQVSDRASLTFAFTQAALKRLKNFQMLRRVNRGGRKISML